MNQKLKHFFDWYQNEKPSYETVLDKAVELSWIENRAFNACVEHIRVTVRQEQMNAGTFEHGSELDLQGVLENHIVWFKNLTAAQLDVWANTPRQ